MAASRRVEPAVRLVVALAFDRVIGLRGQLPWRLPEDLRRFKQLTLGHPVVMGRTTFASIGKPLPGRRNVVLTRTPASLAGAPVTPARDLGEALRIAGETDREAFVIGGAEVFALALPRAHDILATFVYARVAGDARFPRLGEGWHVAEREDFRSPPNEARDHALAASFVRLARAPGRDACALCAPRAASSPEDAAFLEVLRDLHPHVDARGAPTER
jgi:dihydrofolate reductase